MYILYNYRVEELWCLALFFDEENWGSKCDE